MKTKLTTLLLFILALVQAQNIEVSGAGSAQANGIYEVTGTNNGRSSYTMIGNPIMTIIWDGSFAWRIQQNSTTLYEGQDWDEIATTPDLVNPIDWMEYSGSSPIPSVQLAEPRLSYSGKRFTEVLDNTGALENQITITYNGFEGDFLTGTINENFIATGKVTASNVPAGLSAQVILTANNQLTFSLIGHASAHTMVNNISNLTLQFANSAFNANDAIDVVGYQKNDFEIFYRTAHTVCASGCDFTSIQTAITAGASGDIIKLSAETYTEQNINWTNKEINIYGQGSNQTIIQANANYNTATDRVFNIGFGAAYARLFDLTIKNGKTTSNEGGGINVREAEGFEIYRSVISDNVVEHNSNDFTTGGGINVYFADVFIMKDCLILNNTLSKTGTGSTRGGGVFSRSEAIGYPIISNTTLSGNTIASANSGNQGAGLCIDHSGGNGIINNCTFTNNAITHGTARNGGGFFYGEQFRTLNIRNNIIYGNTATTGADFYRNNIIFNSTLNAYHNIIGVSATNEDAPINGDNINNSTNNPLLLALANNGGPTQTHALAAGSPAINGGDAFASPKDQRGLFANGARDIGAFEFDGLTVVQWIGATSSSWSTASNWSLNLVPTSNDFIEINSNGTNPPILDVDVTIPAGKSLTLSGTGTLTIAPGKVLTIAGTANFGARLVTFKSDATGTAMLGPLTGTLTGASNVTVERFIPSGKRAFRLLSPAVTTSNNISQNWQLATHITGTSGASGGFDVTETNNPSMYTYDNQAAQGVSGWTPIANTNNTNLIAGVGYRVLIRGDKTPSNITSASANDMNAAITLSATGTLRTGTVALSSGTTPSINNTTNSVTDGFSLVGNPYQSAVDWNAVTKSGIDVTYWAWDPNMGTSIQRGRYVSYNVSSGNNYVGTPASQVGQFIQPGQAFFVKNTGSTAGTLTFEEADKATTSANVFRTANTPTLGVALYDPNELAIGGYPIDATKAVFSADYSNELGLGDATKLEAAGENIAWFRNNTKLAIDAAAPVTTSDELVMKTIRLGANKNYTFKIQTTNFDNALTPYLVDTFLNTQTEITTSQAFLASFVTTSNQASYSEDRFKIVFQTSALSTADFANNIKLYPNPAKAGASFYIDGITEATVSVYNVVGQNIPVTVMSQGNAVQVTPSASLSKGVYLVSITTQGITKQVKWIVE
jgi:hypothetical protein